MAALSVLSMTALAGCAGTPVTTAATPPDAPSTDTAPSSAPPATTEPATPATAPTSPTPSEAAGSATCATADLSLKQGREEGTAGSTYVTYYLTNTGDQGCTLDGYPGFALLDADGSVIQRPAEPTGGEHEPVQLAPGQRAQFFVQTLDSSIPGTDCPTDTATAQVQVTPPDQTEAIRQPSTVTACDLTVSPVSPA